MLVVVFGIHKGNWPLSENNVFLFLHELFYATISQFTTILLKLKRQSIY